MRIANGMVVSAHGLASEAGAQILRKGGNAFDAAVTTSLMLGVVEPAFSGIGGGGFALLHKASGEDVALDYREVAPLRSTPSMFSADSDTNRIGPLAVATPGLLSGHVRILAKYGTMKFRDLVRPAIEAANIGFTAKSVSRDLILEGNREVLDKINRFKTSAEVFLGQTKFPLLARTLSKLAEGGPEEFYRGSIPSESSRHLKETGGILSEEDFESYFPKERRAVTGRYSGYEVVSMPPPSAGGALLIHGLGVVDESDSPFGRNEAERVDFMAALIESMLKEKPGFGDPDFTDVPLSRLISREGIRRAAKEIQSRKDVPTQGPRHETGSTSHFCVVDREGNAVAATETVECYYGSGVTLPGSGVLLNDEMHDFDITPGRPNSIAPLKRPASSMSPTILLKDGVPLLILGASGSERIISSVFQVMINVVQRKMCLSDALAAPRLHPTAEGLMLESEFADLDVHRLRKLGRTPKVGEKSKLFFGGVQAILIDQESGTVTGAADPRRRGEAVGEG
jgi:gamma-glutamyltranspeptidase/glutathione hydrolase